MSSWLKIWRTMFCLAPNVVCGITYCVVESLLLVNCFDSARIRKNDVSGVTMVAGPLSFSVV